jgi:hypothetical protein
MLLYNLHFGFSCQEMAGHFTFTYVKKLMSS